MLLATETLLLFAGTALLLALAPGPDNLFVIAQSALYGPRAGLLVTLGLCSGLVVHTLAVAGGVAVLFASSPLAFTLLKIAGSLYLLYLAVGAWRAGSTSATASAGAVQSSGALYRRGVVMNVTNPKVSLFFLAFLPQFTAPQRGQVPLQVVALGGVFIIATVLVFGGMALMSGQVGVWLQRSPRAQQLLQRASAVLFVVLAASVLLASR